MTVNAIHLFGFNGSDPVESALATVVVFCNNECAGSGTKQGSGSKEGEGTPGGEKKAESYVTIKSPSGSVTEGAVDSLIVVQKKSGIKKLAIDVQDSDGNRVDHKASVNVIDFDDNSGIVTTRLRDDCRQEFHPRF